MMRCIYCNNPQPLGLSTTCPDCGEQLTIEYDLDSISQVLDRDELRRRDPGVWKYFELLPVKIDRNIVSLGEGGTFLQKCDGLTKALGLERIYIKNETTNPTGSFIDRGMTVLVSKAREEGLRSLSCVPKGNLGASLAAYSAKSGMKCWVQLGSDIDLGKLYQMIAYNANILLENGRTTSKHRGEAFYIMPSNPFLVEGEKTIVYEICEQMNWQAPTRILSPMGTGGLTSMLWKGLQELTRLGLLDNTSSMITGVQAEKCSPIVEAFRNHLEDVKPFEENDTIAVDIRVADPPLGEMALKAIKESNGTAVAVSDSEIIEAVRLLAKEEGIFAEPSAASTIAGLKKLILNGEVAKDEEVVCVITGAGLKDPSIMESLVRDRRRVKMFVHGIEERWVTRLGETKNKILQILYERTLHGYGIWKALKEEYSLEITVTSVYQHLSELVSLNLLNRGEVRRVAGERKRRYYELNEKGKQVLGLK